jgi:hypothetical protein
LKGIIDVLPLAAGALTVVRAAWRYAVGRFTEELYHLSQHMAFTPPCQYDGFLAGDAVSGEYHITVVPGQGVTLWCDVGKGYPELLL